MPFSSSVKICRSPGLGLFALALFVMMALPAHSTTSRCDVVLAIPGNAPFTALNGQQVSGVIAEAAVEVMQTVNCDAQPRHLPFSRMYNWIHQGKIGVATSVLKTSDRAMLAHYSVPIIAEYTVVMVPKGRTFEFQQVTDLVGKTIGGRLGFEYPQLTGVDIELRRERNYEINIQKVAEGTLDGALIGSITGPYLAEQLGVSDRIEFLPIALGKVELGLALSRKDFTDTQARQVDSAINELLASRSWQNILESNGIGELVRPWPVAQ